jgi:Uma2 family endonuclease
MSPVARRLHYTYAEYLALEETSSTRHEYLDGEIYAMAGGTPDHAALAATLIRLLGNVLPPECRVFTSDLRIRIAASGLTTYPDAAVICGRTTRAAEDSIAVINPVLVVEVTSPSTEEYDRGDKLHHYQQLTSVREVLIVSHREPRLTVVRREGHTWTSTEARGGESIRLDSIANGLAVDDVYRDGLEDITA